MEHVRWPEGIRCPRCGGKTISRIKARRQFDCDSCRYQFSVRVGSVLQDSKLPLWKWFLGVYLMIESKKGMSANQIMRTIGVSYKTAWYLCHRIRAAMTQDGQRLTGTVEADETYIGGKRRRAENTNKTMVLGAVQRGGSVKMAVSSHRHASSIILHRFIGQTVHDDAEAIYTDQHTGYRGIGDHNTRHETVNHSAEEWVRGDVHTNTVESVWSLLDRAIIGSYHKLSVKHLPAYLDERAFVFNNRENPYLFRDTIRRLLTSENITYAGLVSHA
jgi:transposase-like protein